MTLRLSANVSLLHPSLPPLERFAAARADGFVDVETWWPFSHPDPTRDEIDELIHSIDEAGVRLRAINLYAGDMAAGMRGVLSHPDRADDLVVNITAVEQIAERTGCALFNALYGQRLAGVDPAAQDDAAASMLAHAASRLPGTILLEALKVPDNGDYPLTTLDDADAVRRRVIDESGVTNIGLLLDTFHLAGNGVDLIDSARRFASVVEHVQIADLPGRGAPGTGALDLAAVLETLQDGGYDGFVGAEFVPGDLAGTPAVTKSALAASLRLAVGAR